MLLSTKEIGDGQLRSVTETTPKQPVVVCEQQPYPVLFSCRHRSYPVECQHSRKFKINSHISIRNSAEKCLFK